MSETTTTTTTQATGGTANTTAAAGASTTAGATTTPPTWYAGASAEDSAWISNKGFQSALDVVNSARNAEKLLGVPADRVLKLADKMRDDNGTLTAEGRAIFERLGAPKEAKEYNIEIPKEYGDPNQAEMLRKWAFERGIPKSDVEALAKLNNEYQAGLRKTHADTIAQQQKDAEAVLRKEWGAAYDENLNIANQGSKVLGIAEDKVVALKNAMGNVEAMKFIVSLGKKVGESRYVNGDSPKRALEPVNAEAEIKALYNDKDFVRRYTSGDREAVERMTRLQQMAHPGDYRLGQDSASTARQ